MSLRAGSVAHQLLSVASAEPQPVSYLVAVLELRGRPAIDLSGVIPRMVVMLREGLLRKEGKGTRHDPFRYALTPAGEQELDRLAGQP